MKTKDERSEKVHFFHKLMAKLVYIKSSRLISFNFDHVQNDFE